MDTIKDKKYLVIKNLLSEDEVKLLTQYTLFKHRINRRNFDIDQTKMGETNFYGDPIMESLLVTKKDIIEKHANLKLFPCYSFWRMYVYLSDLPKHTDRPSCEISVTININSDKSQEYPIFMNGKPILLNPGDGALYCGNEVEHWREEYKGDWTSQVFLHFVDANGPYKDFKFDKRPHLSIDKNTTPLSQRLRI